MGRCQGNGGKESTKKIFQGSGAQGKAKIFQETFKNKKGAWKFLTPPFNREGQSTCCSVSVQRSSDCLADEAEPEDVEFGYGGFAAEGPEADLDTTESEIRC